jgi:alcohol dehydrogenase (cytochrome c)/quinohemoprotein ethanol dehydrogenase
MIPAERHFYTGVRAIDPNKGEIRWELRHPTRLVWSRTGGVLSTAGDIVFGSDLGSIFAVDAETGEKLWSMNAGGYVNGNVTTYAVDGRQQVTVPIGRTYVTFGLPD